MNDTDNSFGITAPQAKKPRSAHVELEREQAVLLDKLSERSGQPVRELVRQAVDRYFLDVESLNRSLEDDELK